MSTTIESTKPVDELFGKANDEISATGFTIRELTQDQRIYAEGGRDFSWGIMIILILFLVLGAIIYYFACNKKTITVTFREKEGKTTVSIVTYGRNTKQFFNKLQNALE